MRTAGLPTLSIAAAILAGTVLAGAGRAWPQSAAPVVRVPVGDPDPADRQAVVAVCGACHPVNLVDDTVRAYADWRAIVGQMVEHGAKGTDEQFQRIDTYLYLTATAINVNVAAPEDLAAILATTPAAADAIAARRVQRKFSTIDDLARVAGVPVAQLQARRDRIGF